MKKNKQYFYFIFALFLFQEINVFASENKKIVASKDVPFELSLLVDRLQNTNPNNYNVLLPIITNIDTYARNLSKEDIFIVAKVEIYKAFLRNVRDSEAKNIDGETLKLLENTKRKISDPFLKWLYTAIAADAAMLLNDPVYKEYILIQRGALQTMQKYFRVMKKNELIQYWALKIPNQDIHFEKDILEEIDSKALGALKNIEKSFFLMAHLGSFEKIALPILAPSELKLFSVIARTNDKASFPKPMKKPDQTVESILAPVLEPVTTPPTLPTPSQEDWVDQENSPLELKNLPKPKNDADWLEDF